VPIFFRARKRRKFIHSPASLIYCASNTNPINPSAATFSTVPSQQAMNANLNLAQRERERGTRRVTGWCVLVTHAQITIGHPVFFGV
jgi:hypothetical protein